MCWVWSVQVSSVRAGDFKHQYTYCLFAADLQVVISLSVVDLLIICWCLHCLHLAPSTCLGVPYTYIPVYLNKLMYNAHTIWHLSGYQHLPPLTQ